MLKLRDISLKKRILLTNFLMIALPVGFLLVLGGLLFAGLKTTGTIRDAELVLLWQDKREALSIQLAVSSLKAKADRGKKATDMEADCRALARWGIDSLIAKNGETVYASPGADYFVQQRLQQILSRDPQIDTLVLACTHYPLLMDKIVKYLPEGVRVLAQGDYVAASLEDYLRRHPEMDQKLTRNGTLRFLTTEDTEKFGENAAVFMPHTEGTVEKIVL